MEFKPSNVGSTDINVHKNLWISPWQSNMETARSTRAHATTRETSSGGETASTPPDVGSTMDHVPNRVNIFSRYLNDISVDIK